MRTQPLGPREGCLDVATAPAILPMPRGGFAHGASGNSKNATIKRTIIDLLGASRASDRHANARKPPPRIPSRRRRDRARHGEPKAPSTKTIRFMGAFFALRTAATGPGLAYMT